MDRRMVRTEDPPGQTKHLRFGLISDEALVALKELPYVQVIVLHKSGKTGEHPHWHIWSDGEKTTNQTVRNRLKKLPAFAAHKGQNDWSFRNHENYSKWYQYTTRNLTHEVLFMRQEYHDAHYKPAEIEPDLSQLILPPDSPIVSHPLAPIRVKVNKMPMRQKFIHHLQHELHWEIDNYFTPERGLTLNESANLVIDELTKFWHNAFTVPEGARMVRNALWEFGDDTMKLELQRKNHESIKKSLW